MKRTRPSRPSPRQRAPVHGAIRAGAGAPLRPVALEFHRQGVAWLWGEGAAFAVRQGPAYGVSCACSRSRRGDCEHLRTLVRWDEEYRSRHGGLGFGDRFSASPWQELAALVAQGAPMALGETTLAGSETERQVTVRDREGAPLAVWLGDEASAERFRGRCSADPQVAGARGAVLATLSRLTCTEDERVFAARGLPSRRQVLERSLAFRLAYHGFREFGTEGARFAEAVDPATGTYWLSVPGPGGATLLRMAVPAQRVEAVRRFTAPLALPEGRCPTRDAPAEARYRVVPSADHGLQVRLLVAAPAEPASATGEERLLDPERSEIHRFGELVYLPASGEFAPLAEPEALRRRLQGSVTATVARAEVPAFLGQVGQTACLVDGSDHTLRLHRSVAELHLFAHALERDWCWISVRYGAGESTLSLADLRRAREEGRAYLEVEDGWLDCAAAGLDGLEGLVEGEDAPAEGAVRVSRAHLLRITRQSPAALRITGETDSAAALRRLVELSPAAPLPALSGLRSVLRPYQKRGAEWLVFLHENGLGGLLCDDMGLGKTHQVMALMVYLRERAGVDAPFLVVCPATVLSHWANKLRDFAPALPQLLHHGGERDLDQVLAARGVVLTSYGVLRNDLPLLAEVPFALAVFDEAQNIKNKTTLAHGAARSLHATMKLAVTGTPIENSVLDLKALLDLVVPGYLGSDRAFEERYGPADQAPNRGRREELARLVSPFTLRRLKSAVLHELPDKIEDLRTCQLSGDQVRLYREAVAARSGALLEKLGNESGPVPYLHVFALLSTLKQICNHPALLQPRVEGYETLASGKWDLFVELLAESLDSGQKVVVFSHFLGMIEIMERHLRNLGVGYATLTGRSRNRGKLLDRFQEDPQCRVFLASLKAGGAGIDLVAGSVVIHYDRWWNAAAEDQATDRVHRIGQTRGVQVFKLVTEGTLEEKIAALIDRKRALLRDVVAEDDARLLKSFSREDLAALLAPPGGGLELSPGSLAGAEGPVKFTP